MSAGIPNNKFSTVNPDETRMKKEVIRGDRTSWKVNYRALLELVRFQWREYNYSTKNWWDSPRIIIITQFK